MLARWCTVLSFICSAQLALASATPRSDAQTQLDQLNQREKHLLEKLDDTRQRERYLESQLEVLRHHKEALLKKQGGGLPVQVPGATPASTPDVP